VGVPAVSVLLPCFRSERFVRRAVESVLAQRFADWELVACDNASDDGTFELLQGYAARDPRIRAYRNEVNVGPVRNWRRCAELATGRLAGLLFSDDWFEPDYLARLVPRLDDPRVGIVYAAARMVREGAPEAESQVCYLRPGETLLEPAAFVREVYRGPATTTPVSPCCALARRSDLARWLERPLQDDAAFGFTAHGAGPDLWVFLQACDEYPLVGHEPAPLVCFLDHGGNLSTKPGIRRAYAASVFQFSEHATRFGPMPQRALARSAQALRDTPLAPRVRSRLGVEGWLRLLAKGG
jgi:glycosyltransferase involved in cell wall biosynthesis